MLDKIKTMFEIKATHFSCMHVYRCTNTMTVGIAWYHLTKTPKTSRRFALASVLCCPIGICRSVFYVTHHYTVIINVSFYDRVLLALAFYAICCGSCRWNETQRYPPANKQRKEKEERRKLNTNTHNFLSHQKHSLTMAKTSAQEY